MQRRKYIPREMKKDLIEQYKNQCCMCSISFEKVPLEFAFLEVRDQREDISKDNIVILCPNCHKSLDDGAFRGYEFERLLTDILQRTGEYQEVERSVILDGKVRLEADIVAINKQKSDFKYTLIECKANRSFSQGLAINVIAQLKARQEALPDSELILAICGRLTDEIRNQIEVEGIKVWDIDFITENYKKQIDEIGNPIARMLFGNFSSGVGISRSQRLIEKLKNCRVGREDCYIYQDLIGEIIEEVFCPPLNLPLRESSDYSKANRKDFIIPNYAEDGLWAFIREKYSADYIVVDAKNYKGKVKKNDVLQIANYLKPHGAGMFGLIFSRNGGDSAGCAQTLREQWMVHNKMILILDDSDVENILVSATVDAATEVISQKIEAFRLSM